MPSSAADDTGRARALTVLDGVRWHGVPVAGERPQALLASLASSPGEGTGEGRLIEEIWGSETPANPTKALQVVVSRTRTATSAGAVVRTAHGYRLGTTDTDLAQLTRGYDEARRADAAGDWQAAAAAAAPVVATVVAADGEGEIGRLRAHARDLQESARAVLGRALSALGRHAEALPLLECGDEDEPTLVALLRSEAAVRGVPAALARYAAIRERLAERLGVDPGPALAAVHADLLARDRPVREGLLFEAARLIGRDEDVATLAETIRASRVTSIVGPGGLGKTRLAHVMGRLADQPVVHFVALAGVTSPEGVAVEVGDVLGVRESVAGRLTSPAARRTDLVGRIVDQVGTAPALLVLDNCEHLIEAVAELVALLVVRTPALKVLTTSRAPLGLAAERVHQLPQLSLADAVVLFEERATAARPGVRLDPDEVVALVSRLDGLPLAIELAAAKVRAMSVAEIDHRLEDRFALLRGGSRDAPERHQTLFAVIDWSWALLGEEQRAALRRLSVFRDGFSLQAADAVVDGDPLAPLTGLVEQSLVTVVEGRAGLRYRLLETVREFGHLQLAEAGDHGPAAARLRAWAVGFARDAQERLVGPAQVEVMAAIRAEEGNLVDALRAAICDRDPAAVAVLMACLSDFWTVEGSHLKVVGLAHEVEEVVVDAELDDDLMPMLRATLAAIAFNSMIFSESPAQRALDRLVALGPGPAGSRSAAQTKVLLEARLVENDGEPDRFDALYADPDPAVRQLAYLWASQFHENLGDLPEAIRCAERSLELVDDRFGPWPRALVAAQLAGLVQAVGDFDRAVELARVALPTLRALGATEDVAQLQAVLATAAMVAGRLDEATRILDEIAVNDTGAGLFGAAVIELCGRPELHLLAGRIEEGLRGYREAVAVLESRPVPILGEGHAYAPWVLFPEAGALSAHIRHGHRAEAAGLRRSLRTKLPHLLGDGQAFLDYPVAGAVLVALAEWELTADPDDLDDQAIDRALRLLARALGFGYNRNLPSLSWAGAERIAGAVRPGALAAACDEIRGRKAPELRQEVRDLVAELGE